MQIPILSGVASGNDAGFELSYPINLEPVPLESGISQGFMKLTPGIKPFAASLGNERGGINWNGILYRVMGTKLVKVSADGSETVLGDVGAGGPVAMDYGFDRLAINSGTNLFYWDGTTLSQVTDTDLGIVKDVLWITGYYVTTDGTSLVVTDLSDPFSVNPLKYGSAEEDPDMVVALFKLRGELYALGQYTIQVFSNVGGSGFPFQANTAATVPVGIVGRDAKCRFMKTLAFVGQEREDETPTAPAVYLLNGGDATKISTRWVDDELAKVADLSSIMMESHMSRDERRLLIHLPDKTLVYCANASRISQELSWYVATSGLGMKKPYRGINAVFCYNKWIVGDRQTGALGYLDEKTATQFNEEMGWRFDTLMVYNAGKGAIMHTIELVGLTGRAPKEEKPIAFMSTTTDGLSWSVERACSMGRRGNTAQHVKWRPHRRFSNFLGLRFRGASNSLAGWAACEAEVEALSA